MMQIRTTKQNKGIVESIRKGDEIILEMPVNNHAAKFFKVEVVELTNDIQRCCACNCLLHAKEDRFVWGKGVYCGDCIKRKRERTREAAAISVRKRKAKANAMRATIAADIQSNKK